MSKSVILISQAKGGCGKSVVSFMLAEKYKQAVIIDADDSTTTSSKTLEYRKPVQVSFLDPLTQRIDRSSFNVLFQSVAEADKNLFLVDSGASVSEQLPKYFDASDPVHVREMLDAAEIDLKIICVVGGGNNFKSTMMYLDELVESVNKNFEIIAAHNRHFPMSEIQKQTFEDYCKSEGLKSFGFDLVNDKGELALRTADNVLQSGKGLAGLSPFKAVYFKGCVENLPSLF